MRGGHAGRGHRCPGEDEDSDDEGVWDLLRGAACDGAGDDVDQPRRAPAIQ
ncbi:unnamed protein product [Prorocentrum cordatum]|uniref:Uncharacterized protein n=1 Tax=Prorocentrum cordatum TaxID=2364126 RepID=A0ABN9PX63_9DINO|nr:unnamed protein product [Polarella glacialis]